MMPNSKLRALDELKGALAECQSVLSNLINPPAVVSGATIVTGYATVVQAEHRARKALTAAESHLASSTDVEGWRTDFENAPRDGDEFQSWIVDDTGFGQWEPRSRFNPDTEAFELWGRVDYDQDGWEAHPHVTPTRWMPSPTPPAILPESPSPEKEGRT